MQSLPLWTYLAGIAFSFLAYLICFKPKLRAAFSLNYLLPKKFMVSLRRILLSAAGKFIFLRDLILLRIIEEGLADGLAVSMTKQLFLSLPPSAPLPRFDGNINYYLLACALGLFLYLLCL